MNKKHTPESKCDHLSSFSGSTIGYRMPICDQCGKYLDQEEINKINRIWDIESKILLNKKI